MMSLRVRTQYSRLTVVSGGIRVEARSDGTSLLVLPFEFSRCLSVSTLDQAIDPPRLVRADGLLVGLLFNRAVNSEIRYFTGPFDNASCRLRDAEDFRRLLHREENPGTR